MPLRDLLVTIVLLGLVPASFLRPRIRALVWFVIAYMNPHRQTWGFASTIPFAEFRA